MYSSYNFMQLISLSKKFPLLINITNISYKYLQMFFKKKKNFYSLLLLKKNQLQYLGKSQ